MDHSDTVPADGVSTNYQPDWTVLRGLSLRPGGFRKQRDQLWPRLLGVYNDEYEGRAGYPPATSTAAPSTEDEPPLPIPSPDPSPHDDEHQIKLDTERSFVLYPVDDVKDRDDLKSELHQLLVSIFRKRRKLSYFQGYHDIVTVIFLTLPKELQFPCTEKLSLHRVRDSMGATLEPVLGLLRILQKVLRLADPPLASILDRHAPLPFYALSNLLTLFSHDVATLPLIQHVFDYLLCRPPVAAIYLAAAIVLSRKSEVERLEEEGEEGMVHSLLSSLPELYEDTILDDSSSSNVTNIGASAESQTAIPSAGQAETEINPTPAYDVKEEVFELEKNCPGPRFDSGEDSFHDHQTKLEPFDDDKTLLDSETDDHGVQTTHSEDKTLVSELSTIPATPSFPLEAKHADEKVPDSPHASSHRTRVSMTSLLAHADELFALYPPTHPSLCISEIMGPQSVVHTWSETPSDLPDDDEAEAMVTHPELIVLPYIEEPEPASEDDSGMDEKDKGKTRRRKLKKPSRLGDVVVQRKLMLAGAVLALSVAMAVYGVRVGRGNEDHVADRHLKMFGSWVTGVLLAASERMIDGFGL
ncbi:hypothetical protein JAAARDRAFT_73264 [Jaapia argillacea MUCL 33604]|uniref:Rab-GAP TBC domain-containing protein n=1 Tax=Jaapia argillacea MUCL 33604 TaxID=933084 RepID=A0A067PB90_9AGAM|nr:hypothetical protein JAAARDRAFT_73264 [Jaapia argillacea MUCL 33604]